VDDSGAPASDDISIAASFDISGITVGVGFEDTGAAEVIAVGLAGSMGAIGYNVFYHQESVSDVSTIGLAGSFDIDSMTTVTAVVGLNEDVSSDNDFSVGIARSLGGGVSFKAGVGSINGETVADAGITFDF
ncbi:MAG: hypothetical protein AAFN59_13020, partial [Pseudomonadota bacterium]